MPTAFDYLQVFDVAAAQVLGEVLGDQPARGSPKAILGTTVPMQPFTVSIGITGALAGHFRMGMDLQTAKNVASTMLCEEVAELDEMALSALSELANMIAGNARSNLSGEGSVSDITPPCILQGEEISEAWQNTRAITIPLTVTAGTIHITVGILLRKESRS